MRERLWGLLGAAGYLGIVSTRFFITHQSTRIEWGNIGSTTILLSELRYVRLRKGKKGKILDIITKGDNITVNFEAWVMEDAHNDEVRRVADLLMSFVNLPEEERCSMPALQQIKTRREFLEGETVA